MIKKAIDIAGIIALNAFKSAIHQGFYIIYPYEILNKLFDIPDIDRDNNIDLYFEKSQWCF